MRAGIGPQCDRTLDLFGPVASGQGKISVPMRRIETPVARATDPESSHEAADEITASGRRRVQKEQAAAAVRAREGRTSLELAYQSGLDRYMLARRLPEAELAGAVRRGEPRKCCVSGRKAVTWWLA